MDYTILRCGIDHVRDHLRRKGKHVGGSAWAFAKARELWGEHRQVETLKQADFDEYFDWRTETVKPQSARRELVMICAAVRFAKKRERIAILPTMEIPEADSPMRRPLTEDEYQLIQRTIAEHAPKYDRLGRHYTLMYWTGCRSRAGEELEWSRVDMDRRLINFNVPGRRATVNKKRVDGFPMPPELYAEMVQWKEVAKDSYVIGAGPRGGCSSTLHHAEIVVRELCGLKDPKLAPRHCMRSMYATEMFDKGANPEHVGALTGDRPDMLRERYVVLKAETLRSTAMMRSPSVQVAP